MSENAQYDNDIAEELKRLRGDLLEHLLVLRRDLREGIALIAEGAAHGARWPSRESWQARVDAYPQRGER